MMRVSVPLDATATYDEQALAKVLGPGRNRYIPTPGIDRGVTDFLGVWEKLNRIVPDGAGKAHVAIGADDWNVSIPFLQRCGDWRFDTRAGGEVNRTRRIGRNELAALQVSPTYNDAQKEYATVDCNGEGVLEYAQ